MKKQAAENDGVQEKEEIHVNAEHASASQELDPLVVGWDGPNDPENPLNWPLRKKFMVTFIVSMFTFISPLASTMIAPAFPYMRRDFHLNSNVETEMMLSSFVLAYAFGPLLFGPLSEVYGRRWVLQAGNLIFLAFNFGCGFANTGAQMIVLRLLSGFGGCAPLTAGAGLLSDCWKPEQRGRVWALYSALPLIGPAIGPIAAAFLAEHTTWRWILWATSIFDAIIQILAIFYLEESYPKVLLRRKTKRLRQTTGNAKLRSELDKAVEKEPSFVQHLMEAIARPYIMLGTQPVIQLMALYGAYIYGMIYLVLATFPNVWTEQYHEAVGVGSLNYISLAIGFAIGQVGTGFCNDYFYKKQKERAHDKQGVPEFRLLLLAPTSLVVPIGLFWYGWSAQARVHWIMPNIGAAIYAAGAIGSFQYVLTYIVDCYPKYTASAVGATTAMRYLASFSFPLFAPALYDRLGWGWGNSLLAFVGLVLGLPAALFLRRYGYRIRERTKRLVE